MDSVPPDLVVSPLSHVGVILETLPNTEAIFGSLDPLTVIDFSVSPSVDAFSMRLIVHEGTPIDISVLVRLESLAIFLIFEPLTFVYALSIMDKDSKTLSFVLFIYHTFISCTFVDFYPKLRVIH
mgnify:CR=1 FL=1